ncbi:NADH-quinone oxidoreductase subunit A [Marinihelvus fidelis]|uniref:NADH-quinone oxidoreductase subunit A n=1 Tax=Marinihelvus fidelis TaxID=2613842 RepID=A0A5N0T6Z7_9GAMM|nr:NADH-quinone oxidoreductase subunit A [Marinihelvus fidelis]KAA9130254.1 NADH-quinone oxidoreductase subunit A [Marinihelvus fidelis]
MLAEYFPILLFIGISMALGIILVTIGGILGPRRPSAEKNSPYECGFEAFEDTRSQFDVRFYLVAILFIIFDLEIAFFVPWALALDTIGWNGFIAMMVFVLLLIVGFFVEWSRGALEWE